MKILKHIWRYLTSPTYRYWMDFCSREEYLNKSIKEAQKILTMKANPMYLYNPKSKPTEIKSSAGEYKETANRTEDHWLTERLKGGFKNYYGADLVDELARLERQNK